ncbi:hypothetical protein ATANTOWER_031182 [Ataeniobius toweri]|uniref:Uncharacterized protein n=1 Tax=Ataeniobius toweri TaxID=208326 RepID=A0ABU7BMA9_9TELE|nr:hypothetical protein [Ataeniobius toweri]
MGRRDHEASAAGTPHTLALNLPGQGSASWPTNWNKMLLLNSKTLDFRGSTTFCFTEARLGEQIPDRWCPSGCFEQTTAQSSWGKRENKHRQSHQPASAQSVQHSPPPQIHLGPAAVSSSSLFSASVQHQMTALISLTQDLNKTTGLQRATARTDWPSGNDIFGALLVQPNGQIII